VLDDSTINKGANAVTKTERVEAMYADGELMITLSGLKGLDMIVDEMPLQVESIVVTYKGKEEVLRAIEGLKSLVGGR
jgi:hypothetical protein